MVYLIGIVYIFYSSYLNIFTFLSLYLYTYMSIKLSICNILNQYDTEYHTEYLIIKL